MSDTRRSTACTCSRVIGSSRWEAPPSKSANARTLAALACNARRRGLPAHAEFLRVGDVDVDRISGELGIGPDELEATLLADGAAAAVASHEKAPAKALLARMDGNFIVLSLEAVDAAAASISTPTEIA